MSALPATIESLAPETLYRIMQLVRGPTPTWDILASRTWPREAKPLLAASLACQRWRDPAQRALWSDARPAKTTFVWLSSPARARYTIRALWLQVDDEETDESLEAALASCTGLRSLTITVSNSGDYTLSRIFRSPSLAASSSSI